MRKSLKIVIIALFAIILLMFGIKVEKGGWIEDKEHRFIGYEILNIVPEEQKNDDTHVFLGYLDLLNRPSIMCTALGVYLMGESPTAVENGKNVAYQTDDEIGTGYLKHIENLNEQTVFRTIDDKVNWSGRKKITSDTKLSASDIASKIPESEKNPYYTTTSQTYPLYKIEEKVATPQQAYILSRAPNNNVGYYHTEAQKAWWSLNPYGKNATGRDPNDLKKEAEEFEKYINANAKLDARGNLQYDSDGYVQLKDFTISVAPGYDKNKVKVLFDSSSNRYIAGPFSIKFVSASYNTTVFAGITGAEVKGKDISNNDIPITGYSFLDSSGKSIISPESEKDFYVSVPYSSNLISLNSINFNYIYMNALGRYEFLNEGYFDIIGWKPVTDIEYNYVETLDFDQFLRFAKGDMQPTLYSLQFDKKKQVIYNLTSDSNHPGKDQLKITWPVKIYVHEQRGQGANTVTIIREANEEDNISFQQIGDTHVVVGAIDLLDRVTEKSEKSGIRFYEDFTGNIISYDGINSAVIELTIQNIERGKEYELVVNQGFIFIKKGTEIISSQPYKTTIYFSSTISETVNKQGVTDAEVQNKIDEAAAAYDKIIKDNPNPENIGGANGTAKEAKKATQSDQSGSENDVSYLLDRTYWYRYVHYLKYGGSTDRVAQVLINIIKAQTATQTKSISIEFNPISLKTSLRRNGMVR